MKTITVEHETDTAHRLSFHTGKCFNLHGHRYRFVVSVDVTDEFFDFYDFKKKVREFLDYHFDHATILKDNIANFKLKLLLKEETQKVMLMDDEPTVENMVDWLVEKLSKVLPLRSITIYETPTNYCTWTKEDCKCKK